MKWIKTRLPALRWICALLVSVSVATLSACGDAPTKPLVGPVETPAAKERLSGVARAIASAMNSADVRLDVLMAMRASPRVGHSLILAEYLVEPRAEKLLEGSAAALSLTAAQFLAIIRDLPELEFVVPLAEHRLTWTGTSRIGVGAHWDSDVADLTVYELSGDSRQVKDIEPSESYEALFVVRPRETVGTRIDRQPDVPGLVIQDPGDGQRAIVWTFQVGHNEPISLDFGQFSNAMERHRAVAGGIASELRSNAPELATAFDGSDDDDGPSGDCELDGPDDCDGLGGGGGGGPGEESYEVSDHDTFFDKLKLHRDHDPWGDSEIRLILSYKASPRVRVTATLTYMDVDEGDVIDEDELFLPVSPIQNGAKFWIRAVELDPGPDDQLGKFRLWWNDSGKELEFDENDDDDPDLSVWLAWESDS